MKERINLHVYPSPFRFESRILKETAAVVGQGLADRACVAAVWQEGLPERESIDEKRSVRRVKLFARYLPKILPFEVFKYLEFLFRVLREFGGDRLTAVSCHSLSTLPLGILLKLLKRAKLVYATHELETERTGLDGMRRRFSKLVERLAVPFIDEIVVTTNCYAEWYKRAYKLDRVHVFYNAPFLKDLDSFKSDVLRERLALAENAIIFLYHGLISRGRAVREMLEVFKDREDNRHLVIMGFGDLEPLVRQQAGSSSNIHFIEAVPPGDILKFASGADVGLSIIEKVSLSYYLCFPNKVFEYVHSGVPVVVSDFPEMGGFVDEFKCGWKIRVDERGVDREQLLELVNGLEPGEIAEKKKTALSIRGQFCWSRNLAAVREVYS